MTASDSQSETDSVLVRRSPELMSAHDTALLVVDVQEKLVPLIPGYQELVWNIRRLLEGADVLDVAISSTEQYPQGLGCTVEPIASLLDASHTKNMFSCRECFELSEQWREQGIYKVLITGIETHVCIQQTVLDLLADGFAVYVAVDAVGSRFALDREIALRRMESAGATLTTTEAALFEWCETSKCEQFKSISKLVREQKPD